MLRMKDWLQTFRRDIFRRGSPSFRWGVWISGGVFALFWVFIEERNKEIKDRRIFLPFKRQIEMQQAEITEWNRKLSGGKLLQPDHHQQQQQQQQQQQGVEAARALQLAAIKQKAQQQEEAEKQQQQQQQQQQHGFISSLLGLTDKTDKQTKTKKVPLLFDK